MGSGLLVGGSVSWQSRDGKRQAMQEANANTFGIDLLYIHTSRSRATQAENAADNLNIDG